MIFTYYVSLTAPKDHFHEYRKLIPSDFKKTDIASGGHKGGKEFW